jgi:sulfate adenylyltransferase
MTGLIPPHGGLTEPMNRTVPADEAAGFSRSNCHDGRTLDDLPRLVVSKADLATVYRIADGGLSPLTGPMTKTEWHRVLDEQVIERGGKKYAWTIPLSLPVSTADVTQNGIIAGHKATLVDEDGRAIGVIDVTDVFPFDKKKYLKSVYATDRIDHPGGRMVMEDPRDLLVGGDIQVLPAPKHPEYGDLVMSPRQTRQIFAQRGFQRVVAFQTRNPLHRAHEYALVVGLERLTRDGYYTGAVLNPLVGETKGDDVDAATRMRTYRALIDNRVLGQGDTDEELWRKVGRPFTDHVMLLGLDIKMFYAGPSEAVMHAIYRQNYGFTDIIIGRKHADAPYDDGTDIWDGLAAQRKFDDLNGELLIQPVKVGFAAFYAELDRVGLVDEHAPKGWKPVSISGRELRDKLRAGELPDPRIMRPETARVLIERMKQA